MGVIKKFIINQPYLILGWFQLGWIPNCVSYLMLCWLTCFDQVSGLLDVCVEYMVIFN
jgi:hypothetical protein